MLKWLKTILFRQNVQFWPSLESATSGLQKLCRLKLSLHLQFLLYNAIYNKIPIVMDQFNLFGIPPPLKKKKKKTYILWKLDFFQLSLLQGT